MIRLDCQFLNNHLILTRVALLSYVFFSNWLPGRMHSHTGCIGLTFLHCMFSNVSSNCFIEKIYSYTGCICLTFLHCAFSYVSSKQWYEKMQTWNDCICLTFLHSVFPYVYKSFVLCLIVVSDWGKIKKNLGLFERNPKKRMRKGQNQDFPSA